MRRLAAQKPQKPAIPIRKITGNIVSTKDGAFAVFYLHCHSYRSEPQRRRAAMARELETFARLAEADFQILRVSRRFDPDEYVYGRSSPPGVRFDLWDKYLEAQKRRLEDLRAWMPSTFLCVRLAEPHRDLHGRASRVFDRTPREIWDGLRAAPSSLTFADVAERARVAEGRVVSTMDARRATTEEVQWLIRRSFCRGLTEPTIAPEDVDPERSVRLWFGESGIEPSYRHLRSEGEFGESFQAGLCLGEMGHATPFSRQTELMFSVMEDHPWPVDAALHVRFIPNEQAVRETEHLFKRSTNQLHDEEDGDFEAMGESHRRVSLARELHDRLAATGDPMLMGTLSYVVSADSLSGLNRRVRAFREGFPWPLYRPYGDQLELWKQHLPGQPSRVRGFDRAFTPEQVGTMVPHGTHEAGSTGDHASYIAYTQNGRHPILMDLREGSGTNKAPTIALVGSLGGGKTMFLQLLLWQAFLQGGRIVDIDPKGDHRFHKLPGVAPHVQEIFLGPSPEHAGKLDPLRVAPASERHDAAASFLIDVLPSDVPPGVEAAISGALTRVIATHGDLACCMVVVEELEGGEREDEKAAGYMLRQFCDGGIARLGFATLKTPLPSRAEEQVTYLQIRALKRAATQTVRSEMSQSQRHGRAVLQLVALYAMRILGEERDRLKVLAFDEASFIAQDAVGQQLLDTLARWARSELAIPILSTQLLGDVAAQDNLIGHWFLFAMRSREHARHALALMEQDPDGPLATALTERYAEGKALYRDLKGRCEEVQIDVGDDELLRALSTTPTDGPEDTEEHRSLVELAETM